MSGSQNANTTLVEVRSEDTVGLRKAAQVLAVAVLAALFAIRSPRPWKRRSRGSRCRRQSRLCSALAGARWQALNRFYHLGSYARTSPAKAKASTVLKPTAVKIAANPTGGSMNKAAAGVRRSIDDAHGPGRHHAERPSSSFRRGTRRRGLSRRRVVRSGAGSRSERGDIVSAGRPGVTSSRKGEIVMWWWCSRRGR